MVRAFWWLAMKPFRDAVRPRGRRQRPQGYRPWLDALEGRLAPAVTLSISNPAPFLKPDTGQLMGMFVIMRSGDLAPAVPVQYQTQDGSGPSGAHAGIDYVATSGALTLAPQQTTATIAVPILGNNLFQVDRTFALRLSSPLPADAFGPAQTFTAGRFPGAVAVGDFNGDGKPDLVVVNNGGLGYPSHSVSVLLNTTPAGATTPTFAPQQTFTTGNYPGSVVVGDFNGDGKPDVAVTYSDFMARRSGVSVLLNTTPTGATMPSFAPQQTFAIPGGVSAFPTALAVGDFNGDGKPDVVVGSQAGVAVLLNTTPMGATVPSFAPAQTFTTGDNFPRAVAVGDFNGDGKPDLAVANYSSNTVSVLLNTTPTGATTASFTPPQTFATGTFPSSIAVGDFNGDGKADLAITNAGSDTVSVLLNTTPTGATTPSFASQQTFATGGSRPASVAVADVDGDGKADLAVANADGLGGPNGISVLLGNGDGTFQPAVLLPNPLGTSVVVVGDFNGDSKPDLAATSNTVSVLLNHVVQVTLLGSPATGTISSAPEAPTSITVVAGSTPQSTVVGTTFAAPLAVDVRDAAGHLVQGVSVLFTAPGHGPSGTFDDQASVAVRTDAAGRATAPPLLADTSAGRYRVKAAAAGGNVPTTSFHLTNLAGVADHFRVTTDANDPDVIGTPFDVTVTAQDQYGNTATDYSGTIRFGSNDPQALLPGHYTFTTADQGAHTFTVTLETAGNRKITVRDRANHAIKGRVTLTVIAPPAATWQLVASATPFDATVSPVDAYGNTDRTDLRMEPFPTSDPADARRLSARALAADTFGFETWAARRALPSVLRDQVLAEETAGLFADPVAEVVLPTWADSKQ